MGPITIRGTDLSGLSFLIDWKAAVSCCSDRPAFVQLDQHGDISFSITFGELELASSRLAGAFQASDANNTRTLLWLAEDYDLLVALIACFKAGRVAVPTARGSRRNDHALTGIIKNCNPSLVICGEGERRSLPRACANLPTLEIGAKGGRRPLALPALDDVAYLQYTSGSTTYPRGVQITYRNIAHNTRAVATRFQLGGSDRYFHWLPLFHDMGLVTTLTAMALGCPVYRLKPAHFARRPALWLKGVERYGATVTGAPNFALETCAARPDEHRKLDLSRLTTLFIGAEKIRAETVDRFVNVFGAAGLKQGVLAPCYGLAEATLMVSGGRLNTIRPNSAISCGTPAADSEILIVDPHTGALQPEGVEGEIWVKGPSISTGYHGVHLGTASAFDLVAPNGETGFLRTGDVGRFIASELYVSGRRNDIVVIEGRNVHLSDIDATVASANSLARGRPGAAVLLDSGGIAIVQEARCTVAAAAELANRIAVQVANAHGFSPIRVAILKPGSLPLTTSGKVRRGACRELLDAKVGQSIYEWRIPLNSQTEAKENGRGFDVVQQILLKLLSDVSGVAQRDIDQRRHIVDYILSSSRAAEFVYLLSESLQVTLDTGILYEYSSISALADYLRAQKSGRERAPAGARAEGGYRTEARRTLAEAMAAMGLDESYVRARGDYLYRADGTPVLDLVGGFGVTLLGHNPPQVIRSLQTALEEGRPINAQGSIRDEAGRLANVISRRLSDRLPRQFVTSLWSTGAEAVEAARRHALLDYRSRAESWLRQADASSAEFLAQVSGNLLPLELDSIGQLIGQEREHPVSWQELGRIISRLNRERLARPPAFVALRRSFHGKTAGAYSLTDRLDSASNAIGAPVDWIDASADAALTSVFNRHTVRLLVLSPGSKPTLEILDWCAIAGIFVEPLQSEGGVHPIDPDTLATLRAEASRHKVRIIADEIQCGLGRCGSFTVSERIGLDPDYVLLGKALGGSVTKLASMSAPAEAEHSDFARYHTSTFADDDLSAVAGLATLDLFDSEDIGRRAAGLGKRLRGIFEAVRDRHLGTIADVRGYGCLLGVELNGGAESMPTLLSDDLGLIAAGFLLHNHQIRVLPTLSAPLVLRIEPSAFLDEEALGKIEFGFDDLCDTLSRGDAERLLRHLSGTAAHPVIAPSVMTLSDRIDPAAPSVAFISYLSEPGDLARLDPRFAEFSAEQQLTLIARLHRQLAPRVVRRHVVRSSTDGTVNLVIIGIGVTSELIARSLRRGDTDWLRQRVREAVALARQEGCLLAGLAGYLSIVTNNCLEVLDPSIGLTSGNTLTVAMAFEGIRDAARKHSINLAQARVAVVGGAGNIGSSLAELLAPMVGKLELIGRVDHSPPLLAIANRLSLMTNGTVSCGSMDSLKQAEVIVSATSAPHPIIGARHLGPRARIVCDVAVPGDIDSDLISQRPDVAVLRGGAVLLPEHRGRDYTLGSLPLDAVYACMAETILLGLDEYKNNFTIGAVRTGRIEEVLDLARRHGFTLMPSK
jgi:acyl-CoA synthetase (AMP-forming)/AMP-acid ligase II/4-aminobutyrate aminotransferase-like enzyme/predicted amino acid dehydrogenase